MDKNIKFWSSVEVTDPRYTKPAKVGGQHRTAVDAQYKKRLITEKFGMYGLGWGVVHDSEKYERVHYENQTCILNYTACAFYKLDDEVAAFPIAAQIKETYVTNNGKGYLKIDDEAVKKVRTDALTKGFTDLGFCADIHMGKFDDQDYVQSAQEAAYAKEQEDKEEAAKIAYENIKSWLSNELESAGSIANDSSFNKVIDRLKTKTETKCKLAGLASKGFLHTLDEKKRVE